MTRSNDDMCAELEALTLRELRELYAAVFGEPPRSPNKRFLARRIVEARARSASLDVDERALAEDDDHEATPPGPGAGSGLELSQAEPGVLEEAEQPGLEADDDVEDPAPASSVREESAAATAASEGANTGELAGVAPTTLVGTLVHRRGQFKGMTVRQLQAMYLQVVGRKTGSSDPEYLKWKIRETQNGNLRAGPRLRPASAPRTRAPSRTRRAPTRARERVMILPLRLHASTVAQLDACWKRRNDKSRMTFLRRALAFYLRDIGAHDVAAAIDPATEGRLAR